jgi:hypothetical protein
MGRGSGQRGARRCQAMVAIGSFAPARVRSDSGNKRPGQLQWRERKEGESSRGDSVSRQREFTVRPLMEDRGGSGHQRHHVGKRAPAPFIGGLGRSVRTTSRPRACCGMGGSMASCAGRVRWRCEWADGAACVHAWRAKSGGDVGGSAAQLSCARRVAPVRSRRPCRAHGAGAHRARGRVCLHVPACLQSNLALFDRQELQNFELKRPK